MYNNEDIAPIGNYNVDGSDIKVKPTQESVTEDIVPVRQDIVEQGIDFDRLLSDAKGLSTFATVDNTP